MKHVRPLLGAFTLVLLARTAHADPATAEALFREARALMDKGDLDRACSKFADSYAQDASSGTLLNLALCHEKQGKIATAWAEYASAASLSRAQARADRAQTADQKVAELEPRLPHMMLQVAHPTPGLHVSRDGDALGEGALGVSAPADPGKHTITASASGYRTWSTTIELRESEAQTVEIPALEADTSAAPARAPTPVPRATVSAPPRQKAPEKPPPDVAHGSGSSWGWIVAGTGVVALGVGAGFGVASLHSYKTADSACQSHTNCSDDAMSARDRAGTQAWISDVGLGLGVVGLGLGGYLLLSHDSGSQRVTAVRAAPTQGGAWLLVDRSF